MTASSAVAPLHATGIRWLPSPAVGKPRLTSRQGHLPPGKVRLSPGLRVWPLIAHGAGVQPSGCFGHERSTMSHTSRCAGFAGSRWPWRSQQSASRPAATTSGDEGGTARSRCRSRLGRPRRGRRSDPDQDAPDRPRGRGSPRVLHRRLGLLPRWKIPRRHGAAGDGTVVKTFRCPDGRLTITFSPVGEQSCTRQSGSWRIVNGSGRFEGLRGHGRMKVEFGRAAEGRETFTGTVAR